MTDPLTIGGLTALALGTAADAMLKGAVGEAVKDAYSALKDRIAVWAGRDVATLELAPDSNRTRLAIAEIVDRQSADELSELRDVVDKLIDALKNASRSTPIGIEIDELEAARINLPAITVTEGTGFRARTVTTTGDFTGNPVIVGKQ
jgi:hypothetical protein